MNQNIRPEDLRCADPKTAEQIAQAFPPDWDMEAVFARSMAKYRGDTAEPAAPNRRGFFAKLRYYAAPAAACLMLAVGIGAFALHFRDTKPTPPQIVTTDASSSESAAESTESLPQATQEDTVTAALPPESEPEQTPGSSDSTQSAVTTADSEQTVSSAVSSENVRTTVSSPSETAATGTSPTQSDTRTQSSSSQTVPTEPENPGEVTPPGGPADTGSGAGGLYTETVNGILTVCCDPVPVSLQRLNLRLGDSSYTLAELPSSAPASFRSFRITGPDLSEPLRLTVCSGEGYTLPADPAKYTLRHTYYGNDPGYIRKSLLSPETSEAVYVCYFDCFVCQFTAKAPCDQLIRSLLDTLTY